MSLNLFPARVAIGRVSDQNGQQRDVFMTPEFTRALSDLLTRVGGPDGMGTDEIADYLASLSAPLPAQPVEQFVMPSPELAQVSAELAEVKKQLQDVMQFLGSLQAPIDPSQQQDALLLAMNPGAPVDWEHPGKIGFRTANTGTFTTLNTGAGTVGLPSFYFGTDTTTGLYRIGLNNLGLSISGTKLMDFGALLIDATQKVRTSNQFESTIVTGTAPLVVASTTKVANLNADLLDGTDWAAPGTIGGTTPASATFTSLRATGAFGCNGAAVQTPAASGGAMATTGATNVSPFGFTTAAQADSIATKLNAIRAALVANGIMS